MRSHKHLGIEFEVWNGQQIWFWKISDPSRDGGSVGFAGTESAAVLQARALIEEIAGRRPPVSATQFGIDDAEIPMFLRSDVIVLAAIGWSLSLTKLERYLHNISG